MPMQRSVLPGLFLWLACGIFALAWAAENAPLRGKGSAALAGSISPDEAHGMAIEKARSAIVETGCGVALAGATFVKDGVLSADVVSSLRHGVLRRDKIIGQKVVTLPSQPGEPIQQIYEVEIEGEVACPQGEPDPAFTVTVELNQKTFRSGERMELRLTPSRDSYLTVLNLASDGRVYLLVPSYFQREVRAEANHTVTVPGEQERRSDARLMVFLEPPQRKSTESLLTIATRDPIPLLDVLGRGSQLHSFGTPALALEEVARWLVRIPLSKRTGAVMHYEVRE